MTRAQVQHLQERIDVQLDIALDKAVERARLVGATDWELRIYTREVRQCLDAQKVRIPSRDDRVGQRGDADPSAANAAVATSAKEDSVTAHLPIEGEIVDAPTLRTPALRERP